jgi:integrase
LTQKGFPGTRLQVHGFMPVRLTEALLDSLAPADHDQFRFDAMLATFGYRLTPAGTGIFFVGKPRRRVGFRPPLKVAEARDIAGQMLIDIRQGRDPALEQRARQQAAAAAKMTVAKLADEWMIKHVAKLKPRTQEDYQRLFAQHINPALGHLPVVEEGIGHDDANRLHTAMARTPRRANYTLATLRALMNYAVKRKLRTTNPATGIKMYRERTVERFLSEAEIAKAAEGIAAAERSGRIGPHGAAGLRLALFTGARSGEVTAIEWSHVDWNRKIIRLPDSKTNEPRTIHLSDAAVEVLKTIPRVSRYAIAGAHEDQPYKNLGRAWIIARKNAGLDDVRLHDLRHSYASLAAGRGVSLQMIGKLLGHKVPATTQRYAHLARDAVAAVNDELGAAMVAAIEKQVPASGSVVKLRRRRHKVP